MFKKNIIVPPQSDGLYFEPLSHPTHTQTNPTEKFQFAFNLDPLPLELLLTLS